MATTGQQTTGQQQSTLQEPSAGNQDRRTRRRAERRDEVYRTAIRLFVESGYENTTMEEIADHADVARATVFNHFQRKSAFIDEWATRRRQRAVLAVRAEHLEDHPVGEILASYMRELARINIATRMETVALMSAAVHFTNVLGNPALGHELAQYVERGQRLGEVRADVDPNQAGILLAAGYFMNLTNWISSEPEPFDLGEQLQHLLTIVLRGIVTEP